MRCLTWFHVAIGICLLNKCSRDKVATVDATAPTRASARPETAQVILPPDSPKLKRIRVETVRLSKIPLDKVVAPGKIEINPNRLSHIPMPVPSRVQRVLIKLNNSIKERDPLLKIESPEVGA